MSTKTNLLYSLAMLLVLTTSLAASATQDQTVELIEWEYADVTEAEVMQIAMLTDTAPKSPSTSTTPNDTATHLSLIPDIEVTEALAPLPPTKPKNNKVVAFNILIKTESNGKHFGAPGSVAGQREPSKSKKGAIGVAQVMPRTAQYIAKRAGIKWDAHKYKHDPAYNRQLGFLYFDYLFKNFNGDFTKVYAAYNAGPTRLKSTIRKHGPHWLSHMPPETRAYVRKNMRQLNSKSADLRT